MRRSNRRTSAMADARLIISLKMVLETRGWYGQTALGPPLTQQFELESEFMSIQADFSPPNRLIRVRCSNGEEGTVKT
ncbi:hypothetical protein OGATHE_001452 [Ogataea polymorpha]|uniref:Uncharacterized protein n=1 Tax=Ogataea polymorpha TaxID=460523 RepID=A0A9P8PST1_9ASCO|nr:hypothetical protein OGATHE_001452 [Ogataea polymorpha]